MQLKVLATLDTSSHLNTLFDYIDILRNGSVPASQLIKVLSTMNVTIDCSRSDSNLYIMEALIVERFIEGLKHSISTGMAVIDVIQTRTGNDTPVFTDSYWQHNTAEKLLDFLLSQKQKLHDPKILELTQWSLLTFTGTSESSDHEFQSLLFSNTVKLYALTHHSIEFKTLLDWGQKHLSTKIVMSTAADILYDCPNGNDFTYLMTLLNTYTPDTVSVISADENAPIYEETLHPLVFAHDPHDPYFDEMKTVIIDIHKLLHDTPACLELLSQICQPLVCQAPTASYSYHNLDRYSYPIPDSTINDSAPPQKSPLTQVLYTYLNRQGIAQDPRTWYGYVPKKVSKQLISQGHFFQESSVDIGLFHGRHSHMLQLAIVAKAFETNLLSLNQFTVPNILTHVINSTPLGRTIPLWNSVFDSFLPNCMVSPVYLSSLLMSPSMDSKHLSHLKNALIHDFFSDIWEQTSAMASFYNIATLSPHEFLNFYRHRPLYEFSMDNGLMKHMIQKKQIPPVYSLIPIDPETGIEQLPFIDTTLRFPKNIVETVRVYNDMFNTSISVDTTPNAASISNIPTCHIENITLYIRSLTPSTRLYTLYGSYTTISQKLGLKPSSTPRPFPRPQNPSTPFLLVWK